MRWRRSISRASSSVVPTGTVTRFSLVDPLVEVVLEAQVAVRQDPDEAPGRVRDRHARDAVGRHQVERVRDPVVGAQRDRLDDHPRLRALDLVDLADLVRDREVAVDDADAAGARERDREARLGDRVHRGRDERDRERNRAREQRLGRHLVRQHLALRGHEQHVVEGQPLGAELLGADAERYVICKRVEHQVTPIRWCPAVSR
jgi:hypothetical protein